MKERFYLTTTLPYVNSDPHIGFALEIVHADIIARYQRLLGKKVFFNTGTDEHGVKIYRKALEVGKAPREYVDEYAEKFRSLLPKLGISKGVHFIRTTDEHHIIAAQEFWKRCDANGFIYKKNYSTKYCVGCELEKTDSELVDGKCPIHPNLSIEVIEEENYFFKFSQFQKKLQDLYADCPDFVVPPTRFNEIKAFIDRGLEDFSISRLKEKMPWGVSVPGDDSQVMYVWFDALVNYLSTIGWPNEEKFKEWWPVVQFAGKDNVRQQSAIWQAMLMAGGVEPSKQIVIHGFITSGGVKMSKSLGNVIDPLQIIEEFGTETLRFFLAKHVSTFEDSDVTFERIKEAYNADLANGLGNLVSRIMKMAEQSGIKKQELGIKEEYEGNKELERYEIDKAIGKIWEKISTLDSFVQTNEPYKTIKTDEEKAKKDIQYLVDELFKIGLALIPFMPETAQKIQGLAREGKSPESPLFLRK